MPPKGRKKSVATAARYRRAKTHSLLHQTEVNFLDEHKLLLRYHQIDYIVANKWLYSNCAACSTFKKQLNMFNVLETQLNHNNILMLFFVHSCNMLLSVSVITKNVSHVFNHSNSFFERTPFFVAQESTSPPTLAKQLTNAAYYRQHSEEKCLRKREKY